MTFSDAITYIENQTWSSTRLGLERTRELLDKLGNPQKSLKFIHVAGSNGKGSTCSMLESILRSAGYKTGMFISPHIEDFCERMQICGKNIPYQTLADLTEKVYPVAESMSDHPSQFELVTAIGMLYFLSENCDIVLLEVGMGGALDSTNVIDMPELAIITNIGLEHTEFLGNTLEEIASTKGGIIKSGCSAVCYDGDASVKAVIRDICNKKHVPLFEADYTSIKPISSSIDGQRFSYHNKEYTLSLPGTYQLHNVSTVLTAVEALRARNWHISDKNVKDGLESVFWPVRLEVFGKNPLFIADGGHNPQCAAALAESLQALLNGKKAVFLVGVLADKDYQQILNMIFPFGTKFICSTPLSPRALCAEDLAETIRRMGGDAIACENIANAINIAVAEAGSNGVVISFGSLYLVGAVRTEYHKLFPQS